MSASNKNYNLLLNLLIDLKSNHEAVGVKLEFESEYTTKADNELLKKLADEANVDLVIKIGGCGCVNDIICAKKLNPRALVAPMIESKYALEKFYLTANDLINCDLYFNLETIAGFENFNEILSSKFIDKFRGIVFGRSDFCASMGQENLKNTHKFLNVISEKIKNTHLELIVGGNITQDSIDFLKQANCEKFETRKIIFNRNALEKNIQQGLNLALKFEVLWLKSKENIIKTDEKRIADIEKRLYLPK